MRILLLALVAFVSACSEDPVPEWSSAGEMVTTKVEVGTINTLDTGRAANRLLRDAPRAEIVRIDFVSEGQDRLGNKLEVPLYVLSFDGKDVRNAKFANLDPWQTMSLAKSVAVRSGVGRSLLFKDCSLQPAVCSLALQSAR